MIIIGGTTASGKSDLAVELALRLNGEVVSADSMQIYKRMNIGTAKISRDEMRGVKHYMLDIVEPYEQYSAAMYCEQAKVIIDDIKKRGKTPIVVGGTGLYINGLIYEYNASPYDVALRDSLRQEYEKYGSDYLYEKLKSIDAFAASQIHKNNVKRVMRAIEVFTLTGKSICDKHDKETCVPHIMYANRIPRDVLYERIDARVDKMFDSGLEKEVSSLLKEHGVTFDCQSMQAIGYREFKEYLTGNIDEEILKINIKQHSRNYAKRQETWFNSNKSCVWLDFNKKEENINNICADYYNFINK